MQNTILIVFRTIYFHSLKSKLSRTYFLAVHTSASTVVVPLSSPLVCTADIINIFRAFAYFKASLPLLKWSQNDLGDSGRGTQDTARNNTSTMEHYKYPFEAAAGCGGQCRIIKGAAFFIQGWTEWVHPSSSSRPTDPLSPLPAPHKTLLQLNEWLASKQYQEQDQEREQRNRGTRCPAKWVMFTINFLAHGGGRASAAGPPPFSATTAASAASGSQSECESGSSCMHKGLAMSHLEPTRLYSTFGVRDGLACFPFGNPHKKKKKKNTKGNEIVGPTGKEKCTRMCQE